MGMVVGSFSDLDNHDGYVIEYTGQAQLHDSISQTLRDNFISVSEELGQDKIYVRHSKESDELESLLDKLELQKIYPMLIIIDEHPQEIIGESSNVSATGISFTFKQITNDTEITQVQRTIIKHMKDDEFMNDLSWEQKKRKLEGTLDSMISVGSIAISLITGI